MLSVEETAHLLTRAKSGDRDAKQILIQRNSPLIKSIIKRYIGKGVDYDDLYQLGALGFIKAIGKYDASYGVKFTTYAVPLITGEVKRFLRDDGTIKVSRSVKSTYLHIKKYLATRVADQTQPEINEIASALGLTREEVVYAMEAAQMPISLFDKTDSSGWGDEKLSLAERLPATQEIDITDHILIKNMLESLEVRDRKVMILRYFRNLTQVQVASTLGISQVQVSRIEQRILAQFRNSLQDHG